MKLIEIINSEGALKTMSRMTGFSGITKWNVALNCKAASEQLEVFNKVKGEVLQKHGTKVVKKEGDIWHGDKYEFKGESEGLYISEINKITEAEVIIDIKKIPLLELLDVEEITAAHLISLEYMIDKSKSKKPKK